jgi:hypothetical protein
MSIQLVDNFYLNSSTPLDNRFVVGSQSFYTNRHDIDWKYVGMRVWDLNDGIPYVWDGSTYSSENSVSISGSGTVNKIPKFSTSTTVTDSLIYDDGTYIGIGNNTPVYELDVTGSIRATANLIGNGSNITNINADSITSGTLTLNRISNSSNTNWLLTSGSGGPGQSTWVNPTAVTVGNATIATNATNATNTSNVNVTTTSLNSSYNLVFATTTGNTIIYTNTTNAPKINPSTGNVGIGTTPHATNKLTVSGSANFTSSIFLNSTDLDISGAGSYVLIRKTSGVCGIFLQNSLGFSSAKSLYHDGNGDLITGGNGASRFGNFRLENGTSIGGGATASSNYFYIRDKFRLGSNSDTGANGVLQVTSNSTGANVDGASFKAYLDGNHIINFVNSAGVVRGKIQGNGASGVLYTLTSDSRLKKDITNMNSMVEKIKMLKPSNYKWKSDDSSSFGFIAQEVYNVFPELRPTISSYCDTDCKDFDLDNPVDRNGNPYYYGLDYGQFTPYLTKALQEVISNHEDLIEKIKTCDSLEDLKNSL